MNKLFVIDDESAICENIERLLLNQPFEIKTFTDPLVGLKELTSNPPDVILLDIRMPQLSGEEVFDRVHKSYPALPIIFLTAYGSIEGAVIAIKKGAFDYIQKPFKRDDLILALNRALSNSNMSKEIESLKNRIEKLADNKVLESHNPVMQSVINEAKRVAETDATVLIQGESGSGKEIIARWLHSISSRQNGPFIPVDCTALPAHLIESELFGHEKGAFTDAVVKKKGLIESSDLGTLFIDEIGDLPLEFQPRFFRFIEEHCIRRIGSNEQILVNCRIICATNKDLKKMVSKGEFREELFYRIAVISLKIPPLRNRPEDIPLFARFFIKNIGKKYGREVKPTPDFYDALLKKKWEGNIREMKNMIERLIILYGNNEFNANLISKDGEEGNPTSSLMTLKWKDARNRYLSNFAISYAKSLLLRFDGNISAAAREAGIDRKTFYNLLTHEDSSHNEE